MCFQNRGSWRAYFDNIRSLRPFLSCSLARSMKSTRRISEDFLLAQGTAWKAIARKATWGKCFVRANIQWKNFSNFPQKKNVFFWGNIALNYYPMDWGWYFKFTVTQSKLGLQFQGWVFHHSLTFWPWSSCHRKFRFFREWFFT